ncbi:hypothetical protein IAQ61_008330 [Plenodomus lingam]|uniref:Predicted protein n=1 Tax=Leptosphaeria maculans (strain JN3 / isolate v23.1.3 / race Av1-4-5-6-7-8) TaxID=985895 RepID=E4ZQB7_LEPMJ|nr:predicted protein [Plenodomus lingam JN3]KAH9867735.1 hypothetical protein IAQ61_008330 [Plenodomus lingam]CBX93592.1 predicted protein [Plenodomus lingam JN3]
MPSQHQHCRKPMPLNEDIVTFYLDGRTTLSEHLPSETIDVPCSLVTRSSRLHAIVEQHMSRQPKPSIIPLTNIDPAGFKLFLDYLTSGYISFPAPSSALASSNLFLRDCIDLVYAHIVGGPLGEPDFQDYIIDQLSELLSPKQCVDQKILDVIFVDPTASNVLKRFVVDRMFAEDRRLVTMLRGLRENWDYKFGERIGCEYHIHGRGVCYRKDKCLEMRERPAHPKPWSADEDPELKAMAEYCLGNTKGAVLASKNNMSTVLSGTLVAGTEHLGNDRAHAPEPSRILTTGNSTVHGRSRKSKRALALENDKPLPLLPPSSASAWSASGSQSLMSSLLTGKNRRDDNSDESTLFSKLEQSRSSLAVQTENLVAECLGRLTSSLSATETCNYNEVKKGPLDDELTTDLLRPGLPRKFPEVPQPDHKALALLRTSTCDDEAICLARPLIDRSPSLSLAPLVKRKEAPSRGSDWLEQQQRLYLLQGTQGFGLRPNERKKKTSTWRDMMGGMRRREDERPDLDDKGMQS